MKRRLCRLAAILLVFSLLPACKKLEDSDSGSQTASSQVESIMEWESTSRVSSESSAASDVSSEESEALQSEEAVLNPSFTDIAKLDSKKNGWGQGTQVDDRNRPIACTTYQEKYGKYGAVFIKEDNRNFYLTFDEGYENGYTAKILDVLKEKSVPAVFFVTQDYVKRNPDLVRRMIDEGHVVGNHSWTHPSMPTLTPEKAAQEITKLHDYIKEQFGYEMTLFRPPMGEYSEQTLALTQQLGYQSVFWSYAYKDWDPKNQPELSASLEKTLKYAHPGAVYLLHAVSETNTNMLGDFIDGIREKGYTFQALQ